MHYEKIRSVLDQYERGEIVFAEFIAFVNGLVSSKDIQDWNNIRRDCSISLNEFFIEKGMI